MAGQFEKESFYLALNQARPKDPPPQDPEYSEYLQTHVFDPLKKGEMVNLTKLDISAFELRHVSIPDQHYVYDRTLHGWLEKVGWYLKEERSRPLPQRQFF